MGEGERAMPIFWWSFLTTRRPPTDHQFSIIQTVQGQEVDKILTFVRISPVSGLFWGHSCKGFCSSLKIAGFFVGCMAVPEQELTYELALVFFWPQYL